MKNITRIILLTSVLLILTKCSKDKVDDSYLYDQHEDCVSYPNSTCCEINGRILVERNSTYKYELKTSSNNFSTIEWEVVSGDIILISGQNTNEAKFRFGENFTTGSIISKSTPYGYCEDILVINKQ